MVLRKLVESFVICLCALEEKDGVLLNGLSMSIVVEYLEFEEVLDRSSRAAPRPLAS